jgi:hypothetical protein
MLVFVNLVKADAFAAVVDEPFGNFIQASISDQEMIGLNIF